MWQGRTQLKLIVAALGLTVLVVACSLATKDVPETNTANWSRQLVSGTDLDSIPWESGDEAIREGVA